MTGIRITQDLTVIASITSANAARAQLASLDAFLTDRRR